MHLCLNQIINRFSFQVYHVFNVSFFIDILGLRDALSHVAKTSRGLLPQKQPTFTVYPLLAF